MAKKLIYTLKTSIFLQATLTSFILTAIFLTNFLLNLDKSLVFSDGTYATSRLSHGDTAHVTITLKHYFDVFLSGNFQQILTVPIFYGFPNSLLFSEPFLLHAIIGLPFYILTQNALITFNILAYLSLITSFLSMFLLAHYFTKSYYPSVLAAIIFTFNPFVFSRFPEHLTYYTLAFIPLIFLYLEKSLNNPKPSNNFVLFLLLTLQMISTLTFGVLLSIVLPIYSFLRYFQIRPNLKKFFNFGSILGLTLLILVTSGFGYLYANFYSKQSINRTLEDTAFYSAWITDYFLASPNNLLYGSSRDFLAKIFPENIVIASEITEHNLFWGFTAIILFILSFRLFKKSNFKKVYITCLALLLICVLLSFGPKIFFSYDAYLPGVYLLAYFINPALHFLRVASRFAFLSHLFLGLICAFTIFELIKNKTFKKATIISLSLIGLLLLEYWNKPWQMNQIPSEVKQFYYNLEKQKDIKVIVELPMGNIASGATSAKYQFIDSDYMLYGSTLHSKKLLNGYSSYIPPKYTSRVESLSINFPNIPKLNKLKSLEVDGIILHKKNFINPISYDQIKQKLIDLQVPIVYETNGLILFNLTKWQPI